MNNKKEITTDVLVIGGGLSGLMAAIKAKENGVSVSLIDKGHAGNSGQSPYADSLCPFDSSRGHNMNMWLDEIASSGEYVNNPKWSRIVLENSLESYNTFSKWGVHFFMGPDEEIFRKTSSNKKEYGGPETIFFQKNEAPSLARKEALKLGVNIYDRTMITNLVKSNNKIIGAMGITVEEGDLLVFNSKVTIICAGAVGFKPNGWPIHELTGESNKLAYNVGASVLGKEYPDTHFGFQDTPSYFDYESQLKKGAKPNLGGPDPNEKRPPMRGPHHPHPKKGRPEPLNALGESPKYRREGLWLSNEFEIHEGRGPVSMPQRGGRFSELSGGTSLGMSSHKTEGISSVGYTCETEIEGLYAAGDALGNMAAGASYPFMGFCITHAFVTGSLAGTNASEYSKSSNLEKISESEITKFEDYIYAPLNRVGGYGPRWVNQVLKNTLMPYFISYVKSEDRLKAALTYIMFLKEHFVPKLTASDVHELRLAHETESMVLSAEIMLRSSLARKESRGTHYREDYPYRDDKNYLAWIKLKNENGNMKVVLEKISNNLLASLDKDYKKRYPVRFPKEFDNGIL